MPSANDDTGTGTGVEAWRRHRAYGTAPRLDLTHRGRPCSRLVVVAAHPDDESLGAGGLIAVAAAASLSVYVVLLTAGEASPYACPTKSRHALATLRLAEMENALARLAPESCLAFLGVPDGEVDAAEDEVTHSLIELLGDGRRTLLVAPWRHDGHPDHDAAGRAAARAAAVSGARLIEYPLLAWTHRDPTELPWEHVTCLELSAGRQDQKARAIDAHVSQVRATAPGSSAPLRDRVLAHFTTPFEHYLESPTDGLAPVDSHDPS